VKGDLMERAAPHPHLVQPELGLALIATVATGVLWAAFSLGVAYTGKAGSA
jgi:hypothetical protein